MKIAFLGSGAAAAKRGAARRAGRAFTLLEVMIAVAIFFGATFSILALTMRNLKMARSLQQIPFDPSSLAAELSLTNILVEGVESGDFGNLYPGASWTREIIPVATNGLFQVNFTVNWTEGNQPKETRLSILLFRPDSPPAPIAP